MSASLVEKIEEDAKSEQEQPMEVDGENENKDEKKPEVNADNTQVNGQSSDEVFKQSFWSSIYIFPIQFTCFFLK